MVVVRGLYQVVARTFSRERSGCSLKSSFCYQWVAGDCGASSPQHCHKWVLFVLQFICVIISVHWVGDTKGLPQS